jgi:hypothetical protein
LEGLRRRSSSSRGAPGELRRRTSSLAALVAGAGAGGAAGGAVSASGEIRQLYPNRPPLPVIPVPIQILDEMPMPYVHMLFITLKYVRIPFIPFIPSCVCGARVRLG